MAKIENPYIRAPEAAALMRISLKTLHNNRYKNRGPKCHKIGKYILYKPEEVLAYIDKHAVLPRHV
jgi:predicted DNA-binding transcriptional regulator AlpA